MPAIQMNVLVGALSALDRVMKDPRVPTDLKAEIAFNVGLFRGNITGLCSRVDVHVETAPVQPSTPNQNLIDQLVCEEQGVWGGPDFGPTRFYMGERITREEYAASAKRQGFQK